MRSVCEVVCLQVYLFEQRRFLGASEKRQTKGKKGMKRQQETDAPKSEVNDHAVTCLLSAFLFTQIGLYKHLFHVLLSIFSNLLLTVDSGISDVKLVNLLLFIRKRCSLRSASVGNWLLQLQLRCSTNDVELLFEIRKSRKICVSLVAACWRSSIKDVIAT